MRLRIGAHFLEREEEQGKVLVLILGDLWRSDVNFHVKRKTKMKALKTICARSVGNLQVPRTLIRDLREGSPKKKIQNVNFFQKGGGSTPKFTFK